MSAPLGLLRTAYFGRANEYLSVRGLELLLAQRGIQVVSVTCGRKNETYERRGALQQAANAAGIALLNFQAVRHELGELDLVVSFSNPVVFPPDFIESVHWGVVNLHPGPLPQYRGCHSLEHALLEGAAQFGATLHFCDGSIDTGPIIDEWRVPIGGNDTSRTLWPRVDEISLAMLDRTVPRIVRAAGEGRRVPARIQDEAQARYFAHNSLPLELELDLWGDWEALVRQVRAYDHPRRKPAYLLCGDHVLRFRYHHGSILFDAIEGPTSRTSAD